MNYNEPEQNQTGQMRRIIFEKRDRILELEGINLRDYQWSNNIVELYLTLGNPAIEVASTWISEKNIYDYERIVYVNCYF